MNYIVNNIHSAGLEPIVVKIKENLTEKQAFILENYMINELGIHNLVNEIYGRHQEFKQLKANLDQLVGHKPRMLSLPRLAKSMIIVTGDAGIGKSALVQEFYQPIVQKGGYFILISLRIL